MSSFDKTQNLCYYIIDFKAEGEYMRTNSDLMRAFRETRKQVQGSYGNTVRKVSKRKSSTPKTTKNKVSFSEKYADLENWIDKFTASDLVFFFVEKAKEAGVKYVVPNMAKECGMFKNFLKKYTSKEICLMIEFVFNSNQDYLDKSTFSPSLLVSAWCNTIYRDSMLWVDDKYRPKNSNREWSGEATDNKASIGEWDNE